MSHIIKDDQTVSTEGSVFGSKGGQIRQGSSVDNLQNRYLFFFFVIAIKIGMLGDPQIGKTTLMVKYVEGKFEPEYIQTLGVNFMEKTIILKDYKVTFTIWDLGGEQEFVNMLPIVCDDATAILFMYDLTKRSSLNSVRSWYKQAKGLNEKIIPVLVGTKYDLFVTSSNISLEDQIIITQYSRALAKAMGASLVFCSSMHSINVNNIFKIIISKVFGLTPTFNEISEYGLPILEFNN
ncbi:hypothetical protein BB560_006224 [Smittium megazygosporum]|uniref:Septum-promoting GTP-binding protein 1 n=1 Tax=Smittium megazygosporum TaxID=133381 RepID=A0A2T9YD26_9FUNG|nr:hypothetical protein BB560_006224 [Smittium megazygosporum]